MLTSHACQPPTLTGGAYVGSHQCMASKACGGGGGGYVMYLEKWLGWGGGGVMYLEKFSMTCCPTIVGI